MVGSELLGQFLAASCCCCEELLTAFDVLGKGVNEELPSEDGEVSPDSFGSLERKSSKTRSCGDSGGDSCSIKVVKSSFLKSGCAIVACLNAQENTSTSGKSHGTGESSTLIKA